MTELDFPAFDADNHYYEATDAFTRHLDPARCARRACNGPRSTASSACSSAARSTASSPTPRSTPSSKPGCLDEYFRAKEPAQDMRAAFGELEPISPAYRDRDARLA